MESPVFRFGRFRLDAQARELFDADQRIALPLSTTDVLIYLIRHRDRPVGRDELASAVWGRVDVSEVSLNHAVMRLRRLLGDTGNEQRVIRTVPRLGYRWVLPIDSSPPTASATIETLDEAVLPEPADATSASHPVARAPPAGRRARIAWIASLVSLAVVVASALLLRVASVPAPAATEVSAAAMVLPVNVDATPEWSWLRLGVMDLIASQLQQSGVVTMPSETVVALLRNEKPGTEREPRSNAGLHVQSTLRARDGEWQLHIEAHGGPRPLIVDARANDPVRAARIGAEELVIKLGRVPSTNAGDDATLARETLQRRVNAALLASQLDVARALIDAAPPTLRATPEIALSQASIEFFSGHYDACRQQAAALLDRLTASDSAGLRARALNTLGTAYFRLGRIDDAERSYAESIRLLDGVDDSGALARAYIGIGGVASQRTQLDAAATAYGRARTLHELRNDTFGVAAVDLNLGMNALQRGQPATALGILRGAATRFERLGAEDALSATLVAEVDGELLMLDVDAAAATAERILTLEQRIGNARQRWELTYARARVLAATGQLQQSELLLARILDASDPTEDAMPRMQADALLAHIALARGQPAEAARLARAALLPALQARSRLEFAQLWLTLIRALHGTDELAEAAEQSRLMHDWSAADPAEADRVYAMLAEAEHFAAADDSAHALPLYAETMDRAARREIPEELVAVGSSYVGELLKAGRATDAAAINGRIATFADRDVRAAAAAARLYAALGDATAAATAQARTQRLAGERSAALAPGH